MTATSPVKVGIVGLGRWAKVLTRAAAKSDKIRIIAGYSRSADTRAAFAKETGVPAAPDMQTLLADPAVKGVILSIAPETRIVDITHEIAPRDIGQGAFVLRHALPWFPRETINLAVVDPGVGSARRIVAGKYQGQYVVAPDNGLLTWVQRDLSLEAMHVVEDRRYFLPKVSNTFQGRDILAPVAAHLAKGVELRLLGPPAERIELLSVPHRAERTDNGWRGQIVYVDRFGNLITNLHRDQLFPSAGPPMAWDIFASRRTGAASGSRPSAPTASSASSRARTPHGTRTATTIASSIPG
ncbi:MAG: SAM-dependent chlorinase/fluorinase [Pseudomonadota bacterium]